MIHTGYLTLLYIIYKVVPPHEVANELGHHLLYYIYYKILIVAKAMS